jgi:hypothetical protein
MAMRHIGGLACAAAGMMLALALGVPQTTFGAVTAAEIEQAVAAASAAARCGLTRSIAGPPALCQ